MRPQHGVATRQLAARQLHFPVGRPRAFFFFFFFLNKKKANEASLRPLYFPASCFVVCFVFFSSFFFLFLFTSVSSDESFARPHLLCKRKKNNNNNNKNKTALLSRSHQGISSNLSPKREQRLRTEMATKPVECRSFFIRSKLD